MSTYLTSDHPSNATVEESENEGRLVRLRTVIVRVRHVLRSAAQVDLAEGIVPAEAVDTHAVVRVVRFDAIFVGCHLDLQVDRGQGIIFGVANLTKLADVLIKQNRLRRIMPVNDSSTAVSGLCVCTVPAQIVDLQARSEEVHLEVALRVIVGVIRVPCRSRARAVNAA